MLKEVRVNNPKSDDLKDQIKALYDTFKGIKQNPVNFRLSSCTWMHPLLTLTVCAHVREYQSNYQQPQSEQVKRYLRDISFPNGIENANQLSLLSYTIPIGFLKKADETSRQGLESNFYRIIEKLTGNVAGASNAILYPISELVGNIFEHSQKNYGWIFAQHYPKKKLLDICIIDTGRGIAGRYFDVQKQEVGDDEAIRRAFQGQSTKKMEGRGYGLSTSQLVVRKALGGQFLLLTGNSVFLGSQGKQVIVQLPNFYWQGVIISYQIPYPKGPIDITPYTE
ncbi:ATP-binding protein [Patescibacteria group bacterium]|nr:ATP-binding protein [Patescibacteria group bacterium]MBU0964394.1 ATP-binding protein [Patescibacteria group bacterium]